MKYVGALQPHRADSSYWNDSLGGRTINNNTTTFSKCNNNNNYTFSNSKTEPSKTKSNCSKSSKEIAQSRTTSDSPKKLVSEREELCRQRDERESIKEQFSKNVDRRQGPIEFEFVGNFVVLDMIRSIRHSMVNMMCGQQSSNVLSLQSSKLLSLLFNHRCRPFRCSVSSFFATLLILLCVFTNRAVCDETENGSSLGPEFTTLSLSTAPTIPPFDNTTRGNKKFGDRCEDTMECGFPGSICDPRKKSCQCIEDLRVTNHLDKCGKEAAINETCFFNEQCEAFHFQTECRDQRCVCRFEMSPVVNKDGNVECKGKQMKSDEPERYVDPAMIGVLVGMALMFIIICVVLRLFSRARWHENRTIFNTPNPRLMNVSLLRDNKLMHGQERRGSRMSVRAPSRQPSMASLRPHSPNPSLAGSRSGSRGSSNASAISTRSALAAANHADTKTPVANSTAPTADSNQTLIITNIIENPAAESVTIEILQPKSDQN